MNIEQDKCNLRLLQYMQKHNLHFASPDEVGYPVFFDGKKHRVARYMNPGEKVWAVLPEPGKRDIVVEAIIRETTNYWIKPGLDLVINQSLFIDRPEEIVVPSHEIDQNGWNVYRKDHRECGED